MNLIKLIFIILFFQGLYGQAIPTPQTIKPAIILENTEDNALVTFIGFEEINGEYKIAKGYIITKNNNLLPRPDIFDFTLDPSGASFFSGAHYKDITGEGIPEAIFLVTNPQSGTYMRSWTLGPGYKTKTSVHKPYYIKTKQKASEAVSSLADIVYADKDYEIAICFGSPERKIVILDHQGEIRSKVIGKKFLENNVGPILLRTADFNNDGMFDLYILSNGAIKEETIYYAPDFKEGKRKAIETQEKIKDIYFISSAAGETKKIILLKNEKIYIEEWEKYFSTEEKETDKIIGHKEKTLFIMNRKGNIVEYLIEDEDKSITKTNKTESLFKKEGFNKLEYLFINEHQVLVSHNKEAEIAIQTIGTTELVPEARIKSKDPAKTNIGSLNNKENSGQAEKETKQQTQTETNETRRLSENNKIENITTSQDSLIINVGESKEIKISLDNTNQFLGLEKIEGPEEMILDKTKLAFIWTPTIKDVGPNVLKYRATHNISEEYEIYFENNIEKLRLKQDLQTTEYSLTLYVNARPTIKISPSDEYAVSANQELVVPIYINDSNVDQTLSINIQR